MSNLLLRYRGVVGERFQTLLTSCRNLGSQNDIKLIKDAFQIAIKEALLLPEPQAIEYINRELDIATMISREIGLGRTSIICALIYCACNSEHISLDEINKKFGISADKRKIIVDDIKAFGTYNAQVKLHPKVTADFKVQVTEL